MLIRDLERTLVIGFAFVAMLSLRNCWKFVSIAGKSCDNGKISGQIAGNRRRRGAVRLFSHLLRGRLTMAGLKEQNFDYFLVLDFEATCDKNDKPVPQEIIEFPVLKVNGKTFAIDDRFHQYVQPEVHKELTQFCTELTGIIQDQVDGRPHIKETLQSFHEWMKSQNLLNPNVSSVFVTCGDWDLKTMLPHQCKYFNIDIPDYFKKWINIKKPFCDVTGTYTKGMMPMLDMLNIRHEGRLHSGIDDCLNIARILKAIAEKGYVFKVTGHLDETLTT